MSLLRIFKRTTKPEAIVTKPIEYCPACKSNLVKVRKADGIYCQECGELLSYYVAGFADRDRQYWQSPSLPQQYSFSCSRCYHNGQYTPDTSAEGEEIFLECCSCKGINHAPAGFCVGCWEKLANNGRCMNHECGRYQKPEAARFIPIYEVRVPSPHCGSCGQPFIVFNAEVGNKKIAEITLGPGGYEWVSARKGCSQCGSAFENSKK